MAPRTKLGILAGGGQLPARIAEKCEATDRPYFIVAFEEQTDLRTVDGRPHMWARLGAAGAVIDGLHKQGVKEVCMIGPVRRPSITQLAPDARAAAFFARVGIRALGDNALLSAIADVLAEEGFSLVGANSLLAEMLLAPGIKTRAKPDKAALADVEQGRAVLQTLGSMDVGQAVIVQQGMVIAIEAIEGTDRMIERSAELVRTGPGAVLIKAPKPHQDRRLDLPTLGSATIENAATAGLAGIAAAAGATLVVDADRVIELCDAKGLFFLGFNGDGQPVGGSS